MCVFVLSFGVVVFVGAPYLPTFNKQIEDALDMLNLQPDQHLTELGSGDGRVLIAAAKRGVASTGYELNLLLVIYSWLATRRYRKLVTVRWANFWREPLPTTDAVFVFLLDKYMKRLDKKIIQEQARPLKLVSFTFKVPAKKPIKTKSGLYLYQY